MNGNITSDLNKGISTVNYTIWNKPTTILFSSGTNWQYSYDGLGKKLQERHFTSTATNVTDYVDNFIYKNDTLQYILTPVGRTLPDGKEQFFVKDHLGNIRSTIDVTIYPMQEYLASFEVASANLEGLFFDNIDEVRDENPSSTDPNNEYSARLNGGDPGHEIGASLLMKVMTGDHINVNVNNFYEGYAQNEDAPLTVDDMLDIIVTTLKAGNGGWTGSESHNTNLVDQLFTPSNYTALQQIKKQKGEDVLVKTAAAIVNGHVFIYSFSCAPDRFDDWKDVCEGSLQSIQLIEE